jgi:hypothetical protein
VVNQHQTIERLKLHLQQVIAQLERMKWDELVAIAAEPWADVAGRMDDGSDCQFEVEVLGEENVDGKDVTRFAVTVTGSGECLGADFFAANGTRWSSELVRFVNGVATPLSGNASTEAG